MCGSWENTRPLTEVSTSDSGIIPTDTKGPRPGLRDHTQGESQVLSLQAEAVWGEGVLLF